jgi:hypothetical protein
MNAYDRRPLAALLVESRIPLTWATGTRQAYSLARVPQLKRGVSPATRASAGTDDERERWSRVLVLDGNKSDAREPIACPLMPPCCPWW